MWKTKKLLQSVPKLRQTMSEGFARILFVKTKGPMVIREAIATTNLKYVPLDQMPKGGPPPNPSLKGGEFRSSSRRKHLITFFEYNYDGTPHGWRCCSKYGLIGWSEFVPMDGEEWPLPQPLPC